MTTPDDPAGKLNSFSRRHFIQTAAAFSLGFAGLGTLAACARKSPEVWTNANYGFGPLIADPEGVLDLPEGFSYRIISRHGDAMADGFFVPHRPDGMATFEGPDGLTIIVRNHEVSHTAQATEGPFGAGQERFPQIERDMLYDAGAGETSPCMAGTTTIVYDTQNQRLVREYLSLIGTIRNCAGGPTPWNTWVSCEESVERAGGRLLVDHGYCFEVPASADPVLAEPVALKAMGRFNHEAIAVDPVSGVVYLTEDRGDGLVYRFIPNVPGHLREGGVLQALAIIDQPSLDTRNWDTATVAVGDQLRVEWIDLDEIDAPTDDLRYRGFGDGAARFARGEGMWYGEGAVYFACTNGGSERKGQIWRYTPSGAEGTADEAQSPGTLELFVEPNDGALIDNADNLTVTPWGDLIVCEDGSGEQFLVGVTPEGELYRFARNAISNSELAGATFSPDGTTLFFNIQHEGLTLAVTGPWNERKTGPTA